MTSQSSNLACDLTAIAAEQREDYQLNAQQLFETSLETRELPNGFAFRLPSESAMIVKAAEFMALERLCCPFLNFVLEIEPDLGPLWLKLTGPEGVKQVLQTELGLDA